MKPRMGWKGLFWAAVLSVPFWLCVALAAAWVLGR